MKIRPVNHDALAPAERSRPVDPHLPPESVRRPTDFKEKRVPDDLPKGREIVPKDLSTEIEKTAGLAGVSLSQMRDALSALSAELPPPETRADRAARWVLRGEMRKMAVLDQYLSGYIKG